jgi:Holliday junction resolvase
VSNIAAEKNFENKVKKYLEEKGCWYIKYWGGAQFTKSGIPDLLICCNGIFLAVELKGPSGKPSELQLWTIDQIKKSGGFSFVLYPKDFEKFKKLIAVLLCEEPINHKIVY